MSFYRKYRPQRIEEIDNESVREQLLSLLTKPKEALPHAFLFSGPKGTGKTTAARLVAKLLNCVKPKKNGSPCDACDQCVAIREGRNIDVLEIDAASNRGIDEIRALRDTIALVPAAASYKVYIIDEVHMLTTEAFNALLKTLEEPPRHATFVLATTDPQKVPATIQSRCTHIRFGRAKREELGNALKRIVTAEGIAIDDRALSLLIDLSEGSFRDAVKLLEQVSFIAGPITVGVVQASLSLGDETLRERFLMTLSTKDAKEALGIIDDLVQKGRDIKSFLVSTLSRLEEGLVALASGESFHGWTASGCREAIRRLTQAYGEMRFSPIAQLPLELAVVEFCEDKVIISTQEEISVKEEKRPSSESGLTHVHETREETSTLTTGLLTLEKLSEHWRDFIEALKPHNHSVAGVLRSARPKEVKDGIVTIEAFYKFHQEKLSETKTRETLATVLKKLFGEKVKVEVVLGKK